MISFHRGLHTNARKLLGVYAVGCGDLWLSAAARDAMSPATRIPFGAAARRSLHHQPSVVSGAQVNPGML